MRQEVTDKNHMRSHKHNLISSVNFNVADEVFSVCDELHSCGSLWWITHAVYVLPFACQI